MLLFTREQQNFTGQKQKEKQESRRRAKCFIESMLFDWYDESQDRGSASN